MSDIDVRAELAHWIENVQDADLAAELADMQAKADAGDDAAMTDAFFQNLSFGTAGLRGVLGAGTNRMNIYTVGRATQGFADYLNANFDNPSVAIARDSRNNGEHYKYRIQIYIADYIIRIHIVLLLFSEMPAP